jgi:hypothetical protein
MALYKSFNTLWKTSSKNWQMHRGKNTEREDKSGDACAFDLVRVNIAWVGVW